MNKLIFKNLKLCNHSFLRSHFSINQLNTFNSNQTTNIRLLNTTSNLLTDATAPPTIPTKRAGRKVVEKGYYDTHSFINSLVEHEFTQEQAEQLCFLFKDIVNYIADDIKSECVTRSGQVS
jgi:hypothetical protein